MPNVPPQCRMRTRRRDTGLANNVCMSAAGRRELVVGVELFSIFALSGLRLRLATRCLVRGLVTGTVVGAVRTAIVGSAAIEGGVEAGDCSWETLLLGGRRSEVETAARHVREGVRARHRAVGDGRRVPGRGVLAVNADCMTNGGNGPAIEGWS